MMKGGENGRLRALLAANVRRLRKARGWSQEVLGDAADLHRTQIGAIERGEKDVRLSTMEKLGAAFDVVPLKLLEG
jgi:transcriptional regulator with XRE-family HTH domain